MDQTAKDGTKHQLFGSIPKGIQVIDASGKYVQIISRSDRAKFKINSRLEGTPEENKATVQGNTAQFGTWSVDEASKTLTVRNEGAMALYYRISPWLVPPLVVPVLLGLLIAATGLIQW